MIHQPEVDNGVSSGLSYPTATLKCAPGRCFASATEGRDPGWTTGRLGGVAGRGLQWSRRRTPSSGPEVCPGRPISGGLCRYSLRALRFFIDGSPGAMQPASTSTRGRGLLCPKAGRPPTVGRVYEHSVHLRGSRWLWPGWMVDPPDRRTGSARRVRPPWRSITAGRGWPEDL